MREIAGRLSEIVTRKTGRNCRSVASFPAIRATVLRSFAQSDCRCGEPARADCIQPKVSVSGPRMRFLILLLSLSVIVLFASAPASATPIKVDLKKLIDQAENARPYQYMPARVGWAGPEKPTFASPPVNRIQDLEARQWLVRLAIPDPRMLLAFTVTIFGLRIIRRGRDIRLHSATA